MVALRRHGLCGATKTMVGTIQYTSSHQLPIPIGDTDGSKAIAHWLGNDIQYSILSLDRWIAVLSGVSNRIRREGYQGTGNAFSVFATASIVLLESEYVESHKVCLTFSQISTALEQYRVFLMSEYRLPGFRATPFTVEYIADGTDACVFYSSNGGVLAG